MERGCIIPACPDVLPVARLFAVLLLVLTALVTPARATILWSDPGSRVIHATPDGTDILGGKVKRDDKASDALYFKFRVDPLSDPADEPYYALFQLVESNQMRLGVGNAMEAWGYSAAYTSETGPSNKPPNELTYDDAGEYNLQSSHPAAAGMGKFFPYELPSHDHPRTIVFKVQYIPGGDDLVTVWLDPNLTHGATAENQPDNLTTKFKAKATFDEIRLRHGGTGGVQLTAATAGFSATWRLPPRLTILSWCASGRRGGSRGLDGAVCAGRRGRHRAHGGEAKISSSNCNAPNRSARWNRSARASPRICTTTSARR